MCNNNERNNDNCIAEILKVIFILQQSVCSNDTCLESCDRGFLGQNSACFFNTRPIVIYTKGSNGVPLSMPTTKVANSDVTSNVFRVEKIEGGCATFRVLEPNPDATSISPFVATNSIFTITIECICAIRCLDDTFVECM